MKNGTLAPSTSPRPPKRPAGANSAPKTSMRPPPRPQKDPMTGKLESQKETQTRLDSYSDYYKKGGVVKMKEGSAKDMREDKAMAKKRGMTMEKWEKSAADKKHDAPKKMATGGSVRGTGCAKRGKGYAGEF